LSYFIVLAEKRRDSNASTVSTEKRLAIEKPTVTIPEPRPLSASSGSIPTTPLPTTTTNVSYSLGHIGAGGNAIAAAASQAIAATQQVQTVMKLVLIFILSFVMFAPTFCLPLVLILESICILKGTWERDFKL
jgi:hypothetical protein